MTAPRMTTPFGAESTARQVLDGVGLDGKRVIVTGASSGIGVETARELARAGAAVSLAVRDLEAGRRAAADITTTTGNCRIEVLPLDLSDLSSITSFLGAWNGPLDVLVNNAGVMGTPLMRTSPGWELQFATNHIGHFAWTTGLHRSLASAPGSRVVVVSSSGHRRSPVVFDDIHFERRDYDPWLAYGQSKTANILFAVEAARRWADDGISVNALHPGAIYTRLQRWVDKDDSSRDENTRRRSSLTFKTPHQGAATSAFLAGSPLADGVTGRYFEDVREAEPAQHPGQSNGLHAHAADPDAAQRLWAYTGQLVG